MTLLPVTYRHYRGNCVTSCLYRQPYRTTKFARFGVLRTNKERRSRQEWKWVGKETRVGETKLSI